MEDCAEGLVGAMEKYDSPEPMNLGSGREITIKDLTQLVARLARFEGEIVWDATKPDGQPRRCLDVSRAAERDRVPCQHDAGGWLTQDDRMVRSESEAPFPNGRLKRRAQ